MMDFKEDIKILGERISKIKDNTTTEEATKNAMVMPFIQALGYNIFDPLEVIPEFTADIANRKGEKVDYCLMIDGHPALLVECKHWNDKLTSCRGQLQRYFNCTDAPFAILTNGVIYEFYTDLQKPNVMDKRPFLVVNMEELSENQIAELIKFHRLKFDYEVILKTANELWLMQEFRDILKSEFGSPSPDFLRYCLKKIEPSTTVTAKLIEQCTPVAIKAFAQFFNDAVTVKLRQALDRQSSIEEEIEPQEPEDSIDTKIITTQEEIEGYYAVKSIAASVVNTCRIRLKDNQSYCAINLDKTTQPIVRFWFNGSQKYVGTFDLDKKETRHPIASIDEIYSLSQDIRDCIGGYLAK